MAGRLNSGGPGRVGGGAATGAGRLTPGWQTNQNLTGYKAPTVNEPQNPAEASIQRSFLSLPAEERSRTLERLAARANTGDTGAHRKLQYLVPVAETNVPKDTVYTNAPTFKNPIVNAVSDFATEAIGKPALRGGQALTELQNTGNIKNKKQFVADTINTGLNFAALPEMGAKTLLKDAPLLLKVIQGAKEGALLGSTTSGVSSWGAGNDAQQIGLDAATGFGAGAVLGGAAPAVVSGAKTLAKGVGNEVGRIVNNLPATNVNAAGDGIKIGSMADVNKTSKLDNLMPSKVISDWLDRGYQLKQMVNEVAGKNIRAKDNPYELMKLVGGTEGQVAQHLDDTAGWMKHVPAEIRRDGDAYGYAKQFLSQPNKRTPEQLQAAKNEIASLKQRYGDNLGALDEYVQKTRKTFDSLLDLYHQNGLIDDATHARLKKNPDYFAKMEVIQNETDNMFRGGNSVNTREASGVKTIKGQKNNAILANSAEAYVAQAQRTFKDLAHNRVGLALGKLAEQHGGEGTPLIKLRNTENVLGRNEIYSQLKHSAGVKSDLIKLIRNHKGAIRDLQGEVARLQKTGQKTLNSKQDQARSAIIKGANGGGRLPANGSKVAKMPTVDEAAQLLQDWLNSDKSGMRGIIERLSGKREDMANLQSDLSALEGTLRGELSKRKDLWDQAMKLRDKNLPEGYTRISYMEKGVRNEVAVPKEIGDYLTGANVANSGPVVGAISKVLNGFRQSVTTYNPLFVFYRNPVRDYRDWLVNSKYVPAHKAAGLWARSVLDGLVGGDMTKEFLRAGGGQAGYLAQENGRKALSIAKEAKKLTGSRSIAGRVLTSPRDFMDYFGKALENAPRLAEFQAAKDAGLTAQEAAIAGRQATVDFAQGGNQAKLVNQLVPFFNARIQGSRRTVQAFKENPRKAIVAYTATAAAPMAALMYWNKSQFPQVWDGINDSDKQNNFIFVYGTKTDSQGNYTQVVKVPKSYIDQTLGNTLETIMDQFSGSSQDALHALGASALATVSNFSPIGFEKNGQLNGDQALAGLGPLAEPFAQSGNKDFFTGNKIVPDSQQYNLPQDQVKPNTPELYKQIGRLTGISPLRVEHAAKSVLGNLPTDITGLGAPAVQRMIQGASVARGGVATDAFYQAYTPAFAEKQRVSAKITDLLKNKPNSTGEATRLADEYNASLKTKFEPYIKKYRGTADYDPALEDKIKALEISMSKSSISARTRKPKEKKLTSSTSFLQ